MSSDPNIQEDLISKRYSEACYLHDNHRTTEAISVLNEIIEYKDSKILINQWSDDARRERIYNKAHILFKSGDYSKAITEFNYIAGFLNTDKMLELAQHKLQEEEFEREKRILAQNKNIKKVKIRRYTIIGVFLLIVSLIVIGNILANRPISSVYIPRETTDINEICNIALNGVLTDSEKRAINEYGTNKFEQLIYKRMQLLANDLDNNCDELYNCVINLKLNEIDLTYLDKDTLQKMGDLLYSISSSTSDIRMMEQEIKDKSDKVVRYKNDLNILEKEKGASPKSFEVIGKLQNADNIYEIMIEEIEATSDDDGLFVGIVPIRALLITTYTQFSNTGSASLLISKGNDQEVTTADGTVLLLPTYIEMLPVKQENIDNLKTTISNLENDISKLKETRNKTKSMLSQARSSVNHYFTVLGESFMD